MKTIIARFEDMKKDPMAILEDGVSANKVEEALASIGIALRNSEGEFRALQDVMDELGMRWNSLTRNQQAYIATVAAGSRQQSRFLALMNNYDRTLDLINESQNSAGAAAEQYAIYQDSAAAATARLTAAWEEFYSKIVNSEQIIWVINALEKLVETMSKIGPVATAIGTTIGALGLNLFGKAIIPNITKSLADVASTGQVASLSIGAIVKGGGALLVTFGKVAIVIGAVVGVVWLAVKAWQALDRSLHKDRETIKGITEDIKASNEKIEEYSKNTKSLEKLMDRYDELSNKVYRSREEQEELNNIINQINENSERAIVSIKANGDAHLDNAKSVREEIEAKKDLVKFEANQKYNKQQDIFDLYKSGKTVTAEQAKEANLSDLADYLELQESDKVKQYNQIKEDLKNYEDLNNSEDFYKLSKRILTTKEQEKVNAVGQKYGIEGENISWEDIQANILDQEKIEERAEEISKETGKIYHAAEVEATEEAKGKVLEAAQDFIDAVYNEDIEFLEKYTNDDYAQQKFANAEDQSLKQKYTSKASVDDRYNILLDLFEKTGMNAEEFQNEIGDEEKFLETYSKALEEYNNSKKTPEDIQKLIEAITKGKKNIADALSQYVDDIIKQSFASTEQKQQFINENNDLFNKRPDVYARVMSGSVTNNELFKMQELVKSNEFNESNKFKLFDLFAEDDTTLNDLIDDYTNKVANGLYKEADTVKQAMIKLLADKDISGDAAALLADFFVEDYQSEIDKRLSKAEGDYDSAKDIYNKDSGEALIDKEYEFLQGQDHNIDRYIAINEEGEKYLSILGKVVILENARNEYVTSLQNKIEDNNHSLELARTALQEQKNILKDNVDLEEDDRKEAERLVEVNQQKINDLETSNNLLEQQLNVTADIVDKTMSISFKENLSQAQQTYDNINKIGKALGEAKQNAGQLSFATAQSLLALDDAYYQYIDIVDGMVKLDTEGANEMMKNEKAKYDTWLDAETKKLDEQIAIYEAENQLIENYFVHTQNMNEEEKRAYLVGLEAQLNGKEQELNNLNKAQKDSDEIALKKNSEFLSYMEEQLKEFYGDWAEADAKMKQTMASSTSIDRNEFSAYFKGVGDNSSSLTVPAEVKIKGIDWNNEDINEIEKQLKDKIEENLRNIDILKGVKAKLKDLSPAFQEAFEKGISEAAKGGKEALQDFAKIVDNLIDALEDLDKLLIDIKRDLDDISVDYNPFTDLFEAWEHEWDYYYNIKRLIQQIGTQGQMIDNMVNADYLSADERLRAEDAKMGNILAQMAANDTYITALRAGMAQNAVDIMDKYGDYYKIDPETGQIYQTDKNLTDINKTIDDTGKEIYDLQKLQNEKENDLTLEEAKLDALEKEKQAYEDILSTIDSQINSLEDNEDITVDLTELKNKKVELEAKIKVTDDSIAGAKDGIKKLQDEIQEIEIQIALKQGDYDALTGYVDDMIDAVGKYEEMWDTLNEQILNQQDLLGQLQEMLQSYIDAAINTQQDLYDAIVENYQREIDQKKRQYDYLKQLDQDYLKSIKDNISKERQIREDAAKQRSYQQSLQRAQLLQMDTSGAFRNDLANLNKEIEGQRQDLYDSMIDQQISNLEKEIEKRHELYDKEIKALEERLAYMQENAILLWAMVNDIVSQGAEAMMQTLEGTTQYINSNELQREQQRKQWELNTKKTYQAVEEGYITSISTMIQAGEAYLINLTEVRTALSTYAGAFDDAKKVVDDYNNEVSTGTSTLQGIFTSTADVFTTILNDFMTDWNAATYKMTGYAESWSTVVDNLRNSIDKHITELRGYYDSEGNAINTAIGSIGKFSEKLTQASNELYNQFIEDRNRQRDELESLISTIQAEITAAIQGAAAAIQNAANSIQFSAPAPSTGGSGGGGGGGYTPSPSPSPSPGSSEPTKKYNIKISGDLKEKNTGITHELNGDVNGYNSTGEALKAADDYVKQEEEIFKQEILNRTGIKNPYIVKGARYKYYLQGGLADFTGLAWLDGTKSNPERILSPKQTKLFESMVASLEKASNNSTINSALGSSYNIGDINTNINVEKLDNETDIDMVARQVENRIMKSIRNRVSVAIA